MTKVSVFGTEKKKGKPIEFVKLMHSSGVLVSATRIPKDFSNIQLLYKGDELDTILSWDDGK